VALTNPSDPCMQITSLYSLDICKCTDEIGASSGDLTFLVVLICSSVVWNLAKSPGNILVPQNGVRVKHVVGDCRAVSLAFSHTVIERSALLRQGVPKRASHNATPGTTAADTRSSPCILKHRRQSRAALVDQTYKCICTRAIVEQINGPSCTALLYSLGTAR